MRGEGRRFGASHVRRLVVVAPQHPRVGIGEAGPFDPPDTFDGNEAFLQGMNIALFARLRQLRIPVTTDFYGPGTHSWPYWERELHRSLPVLLGAPGRASSSAEGKRQAVAKAG